MTLQPGDAVGDYRIVAPLYGTVYRAYHQSSTGRRVVLDVRSPWNWRLVSVQMLRAAAALERLDHPGIARIIGHGVLPEFCPWVASEVADGPNLHEIGARGSVDSDGLVEILRDIAEVLAFAHANDIVHGAVRPIHITIPTDPARRFPVSVGDWSMLRAPGIPAFGDPPKPSPYTAPEHLVGAIDGRADVYSLGAIASHIPGDRHPQLEALIRAMLEPDVRRRPAMGSVHRVLVRMASDEDRVITSAKLPRPRWTPAPPALAAHVPEAIDLVVRKRR